MGKMKNRDYAMETIEEFLAIPQDNTNLVIELPQRALNEIEAVKNAKNRQELVTRALKKYVINARQAQTNAKIVEALLA